jgi:hypothetical protein
MKALTVSATALLMAGCGGADLPTRPSASAPPSAIVVPLEAEAGTGDGQIKQRSAASNGRTVHLAPGERREWRFKIGPENVHYALSLTYSNSRGGDNETLTVMLDGAPVSSFRNRNSGENDEGWNMFVTDRMGSATLTSGAHTLIVSSSGGDGCVELDLVTLAPAGEGR